MFESLHRWSIAYGGWDFIPNLVGTVAEGTPTKVSCYSYSMTGSRRLFWNKFHVVGPATAKCDGRTYRAETVEQRVDGGLAERRCCRSAT